MTKIFKAYLYDDSTVDSWETDQAVTDTPTLFVYTTPVTTSGIIRRVHFRMNPANAVTYDLYLFAAAYAGDYESQAHMLFNSEDVVANCADDTEYDAQDLNIPFVLVNYGLIFYILDWSGAPGATTGYIHISGEREDMGSGE